MKPNPFADSQEASDAAPSSDSYQDSGEDMAAEDLMDCLGVPQEKRADAKSALHSYVVQCVHKELAESQGGPVEGEEP